MLGQIWKGRALCAYFGNTDLIPLVPATVNIKEEGGVLRLWAMNIQVFGREEYTAILNEHWPSIRAEKAAQMYREGVGANLPTQEFYLLHIGKAEVHCPLL